MAGRALTEDAVLAGLQDIRLPAAAPGGLVAELLAAIALGLLIALALGLLARVFLRPRARENGNRADLKQPESEDALRLQLLCELKVSRPEVFAAYAANLYAPGGLPDIAVLKAEIQAR